MESLKFYDRFYKELRNLGPEDNPGIRALKAFYSIILGVYEKGLIQRNDAAYCIAQTSTLKGKYARQIQEITFIADKFDNPAELVLKYVAGDPEIKWNELLTKIQDLPDK